MDRCDDAQAARISFVPVLRHHDVSHHFGDVLRGHAELFAKTLEIDSRSTRFHIALDRYSAGQASASGYTLVWLWPELGSQLGCMRMALWAGLPASPRGPA